MHIPCTLKILYVIFVFVSKFLGGDNFCFSTISAYDKLVHEIYGMFSFFVSMYILVKYTSYNDKNLLFNILFIISLVLATSVVWEILEFSVDNMFHKNGQRLETGIDDTIIDMLSSFVVSVVLSVVYFIEIKFEKKLLISKFINTLN